MYMPKITLLAFLVASSSASVLRISRRQGIIPQCAIDCRASLDLGGCDPEDSQCLCNNQEFVVAVEACINDTCDIADTEAALEIIETLCV
ncbi:hypothetical protein D9758_000683 [Tetrapyrgos nigripes]|uniref:CFEM domain-containing protein n=1 Tax=Tetrapyrgos nigripes TaxID=182062 RepID=A0A8H5GZ17_9AGAR|nr:hypothetical protein D9758_000683 [Tetrapyrgos nigripes]